MARSNDRPRNVLVTRFSALGDVAMTIPVLYPACRANPDVRFVMLTRPLPATMFHDRPANLEVVDADVDKVYKGIMGLRRLAARLRKQYDIDAVADLHSVMRSWVIDACMRLHGIPVARLDKQRAARRDIVKHKIDAVTPTIERYRQVFIRLGLDAPDTFTRLFDGSSAPVSPLVPPKEAGEHWIAVAPFAAHEGKAYPMELMTRVVQALSQRPGYHIFLMGGGKAEKTALRAITRQCRNTVSMAEAKHSFLDEYALLLQCDAMITMDSANMHIASLVRLPAVTVWGATHPSCGFMGYGQDVNNSVQLDLPCRPCCIYGEKACRLGDYRCLNGIDPQTIIDKIIQLVEKI